MAKTTNKQPTNLARDAKVNDAVKAIVLETNDDVVVRCEPDYGVWLIARVQPRGVVYRVTDRHSEWDRERTFRSFREANNFYIMVVGAGSWGEYDRESHQAGALTEHKLVVKGTDIYRKGDPESVGYFGGAHFLPSQHFFFLDFAEQERVRAGVTAFLAVR